LEPKGTKRYVLANGPDIIKIKAGKILLIDVAIPLDRNAIQKEAERN
jgi:hypothetical protein